jgi:hypothetical protein
MNLLGISWGMGARDVGMKAAVTGAQSNLDKLNEGMEQQSKIAGKSKGPGFWAKMKQGVRDFNIASIASDVHALTGDTGNLSNSLESMAVANAKAAKPFVASLNLTGKEMRRMTSRISGMAIGMNVGAEAVAEVFKSMHQAAGPAKEALDALGYSEKDWVKISETTGIKVSELTDVMGGMRALWKATAPEEAAFINRLVEIGKKAGLGLQPIKSLKENIETLGKPFEKLPPELQRSGKEMMGLAESATRMGGVFRELGSSEEEATSLGMQTASMFAEQAVAIERAQKYGLNALDESPLFKWLTSLGVGYSEATNIIETGSRDAVKGTQLIQDQFKRFGMGGAQQQAMLAELSGALGESASGLGYLVQNTDAGTKALSRMSAMTVTGKDGLRKYANAAFSSGRTLQESYDLAKEAFDTQIRSISRKDVVGLISSKMGAFREVGKEMKALAEEGGPMSMLVRGMSTFKQMGIQGVFLQVGKAMGMDVKAAQKMSIKLGLGMETLQGFAQELGPLMNMLGQFGPMGIAAGGIAGFFMLDDADRAKIVGALGPMWEKVKQGASDIWYGTEGKSGLKDWLIGAWDTFAAYVKTHWPEWKKDIGAALTWIVAELGPAVAEVVKTVASSLVGALDGNSAMIGGAIGGAILGGKVFGLGLTGTLAGAFYGSIIAGGMAANEKMKKDLEAQKKKDQDDYDKLTEGRNKKAQDLLDAGKKAAEEKAGGRYTADVGGGVSVFGGVALEEDPGLKLMAEYEQSMEGLQAAARNQPGFYDYATELFLENKDAGKALLNKSLEEERAFITQRVRNEQKFYEEQGGIMGFMGKALVSARGASEIYAVESVIENATEDGYAAIEGGASALQDRLTSEMMKVQYLPEVQQKMKTLRDLYESKQIDFAFLTSEADRIVKQYLPVVNKVAAESDAITWAASAWDSELGAFVLTQEEYARGMGQYGEVLQAQAEMFPNAPDIGDFLDPATAEMMKNQAVALQQLADARNALGESSSIEDAYDEMNQDWMFAEPIMPGEGPADEMSRMVPEPMAADQGPLVNAANKFAESINQTNQLVGGAVAAAQSELAAQSSVMATSAYYAGQAIVTEQGKGISENAWVLKDAATKAAGMVAPILTAGSPVDAGPLENVGAGGESDPAYMAGRNLMESFASGIDISSKLVADAVTSVLDDSVFATFDAYKMKMDDLAKKKPMLMGIADAMVQSFAGSIENVEIEGKTENVKANIKAMLSIPGLAGVVAAVISEGSKSRAILDKIRGNTETLAKAVGEKGGKSAFNVMTLPG